MVDTVRGVIRVRKWPKKRGKKRNETNLWWSEWLRQAMAIWRWSDPRTQQLWRDATRDLPVKVTDPFMQAIRGTIWYFVDDDGNVMYPTQARDKVSYSLDTIIQLPGGMLYRGPNDWEGIEPAGSSGLVMFSDANKMPAWGTPDEANIARQPIGVWSTQGPIDSIPNNDFMPIPYRGTHGSETNPPMWSDEHPTRFVAPTAGWYMAAGWVELNTSTNPNMHLNIMQNGNPVPIAASQFQFPGTHIIDVNVAQIVFLNANDYIEFWVLQINQGSLSIPLPNIRNSLVRIG